MYIYMYMYISIYVYRKKHLGREKETSACEKRPEGADKAPPPQIKKALGAPVTLWMHAKISRQNPGNGGDQPSAREAHPLALTRARGGRVHPIFCPPRREHPLGLLEKVCSCKTKRGKQKQAREAKKHPCRLASRKRASEGGRAISSPSKYRESKTRQNARGPEWRPGGAQERKGARPKREISPVAAAGDKDKKKGQEHKVRVGVCPVTT